MKNKIKLQEAEIGDVVLMNTLGGWNIVLVYADPLFLQSGVAKFNSCIIKAYSLPEGEWIDDIYSDVGRYYKLN